MGKRILIVDDDIGSVSAARRALNEAGHRPVLAASVADAEAFLENEAPDLVLLSLGTDGGQGLEICELFREQTDAPALPILFLGDGQGPVRDAASALRHGGDGYFEKPVDWKRLLDRVAALFGEPTSGGAGAAPDASIATDADLPTAPGHDADGETADADAAEGDDTWARTEGEVPAGSPTRVDAWASNLEAAEATVRARIDAFLEDAEPERTGLGEDELFGDISDLHQAPDASTFSKGADAPDGDAAPSAAESEISSAIAEELAFGKRSTEAVFAGTPAALEATPDEAEAEAADEGKGGGTTAWRMEGDEAEEEDDALGEDDVPEPAVPGEEERPEAAAPPAKETVSGASAPTPTAPADDGEDDGGVWEEETLEADWTSVRPTTPGRSRLGGGWGEGVPATLELMPAESHEPPRTSRLPEIADVGEPPSADPLPANVADPSPGDTVDDGDDASADTGPLGPDGFGSLFGEDLSALGVATEVEVPDTFSEIGGGFEESDFGGLLDDEGEADDAEAEVSAELLGEDDGDYDPMAEPAPPASAPRAPELPAPEPPVPEPPAPAPPAPASVSPAPEPAAPAPTAPPAAAIPPSAPPAPTWPPAPATWPPAPAAWPPAADAVPPPAADPAPQVTPPPVAPPPPEPAAPKVEPAPQPGPAPFPAVGDLVERDVPHLLTEAYRARATGVLEVQGPAGLRRVHLELGRPVAVVSDVLEEQLPEVAFRLGRIGREQADALRRMTDHSPRRQALHLVESGAMKAQELYDTVRAQAQAALFGSFTVETGRWRWHEEGCPDDLRVALPDHPHALVTEGIRRKLVLSRIHRRLGGPATILAPSPTAELHHLSLSARERRVAEQVDGLKTAEELVFASGLGEEATYQVLYALAATVQATVQVRGPMPEGRAATPEERAAEVQIDRQRIEEKFRQALESDYFEVLGVPPDATTYEIRTAHERLTRLFHPSRYAEEAYRDVWGKLEEIRRALDDAYDVLKDDGLRTDYFDAVRGRARTATGE